MELHCSSHKNGVTKRTSYFLTPTWGRRKDYRIVPVLCHVSFDAIPDMIEGKKAFHINDFDTYLAELVARVNK